MNVATVPHFFEYTDEHSEIIFNHPTPIAFLLSSEKDQAYQAAFKSASDKQKGKMFFATASLDLQNPT